MSERRPKWRDLPEIMRKAGELADQLEASGKLPPPKPEVVEAVRRLMEMPEEELWEVPKKPEPPGYDREDETA